jgi:sugar phosphate isomerase/epimerase
MATLSRREFAASAAWFLQTVRLAADPLGLPIGCQTFPVRNALGKDFAGTLGQLAALGYKRIEMCSPAGYKGFGFGPLVDMKTSDLRDTIHAAGLGCESCHFGFAELKNNLDERIAFGKELGLKQMVLATFGLPGSATLGDWNNAAGQLNKIAEKVQAAGMQQVFHNHHFEFKTIDGVLVYDQLMNVLDPKLVKMQFQVSVISLGYEAATYLTKYPGRFQSMHLQDWSPTEKKDVAIGQGTVDWNKTFAAAKVGGIKNYFVELDMPALKPSYDYLHTSAV